MDVCNNMDCFSNSFICVVPGSTDSNLYKCYVKLHSDYTPQCKLKPTTGFYVMISFVSFIALSCCCGGFYYYKTYDTNTVEPPKDRNNPPFNGYTANPVSSDVQLVYKIDTGHTD